MREAGEVIIEFTCFYFLTKFLGPIIELICLSQLFLLRVVGFLLPCYIMAWAISILQRRRQRQVSCFSVKDSSLCVIYI